MAFAYNAQSTAMISVMSSVGKPTEVSTITMVTSPACGIPAAPMLAAVAVMLKEPHLSFLQAFTRVLREVAAASC